MTTFHSLNWSAVADRYTLNSALATGFTPNKVDWHQSATEVFDDFTRHSPLQLKSTCGLPEAEQLLQQSGERYACVLDAEQQLIGILALRDIHTRASVALAKSLEVTWAELTVEQMMMPVRKLPLITRQQLERAKIGDAVATMQQSGREYLLVHQHGNIQGLVSSLGVAERTGESVRLYHRASSFAEIMQAVKHGTD